MRGKITAILVLCLLAQFTAGARAQGEAPLPAAPTNYLITIKTYPQLRGADCSDPYGDITTVYANWAYRDMDAGVTWQGSSPLNINFTGSTGCDFQIGPSISPSNPHPHFRVWVRVHFHLSVWIDIPALYDATTYNMPLSKAGDAWNTLYPPYGSGDNVIDSADYNLCLSSGHFGTSYGQSGYIDRCDFDGDGAITVAEYNVIVTNFGRSGDAPPW